MPTRTATCSCGAVRVCCEGEPVSVSLCHCRDCQRRTGAPFGIAAFYRRSAVTASGETRSHTRAADSGFPVTFHFCTTCGSTVWWEPSRKPEFVAVASGAFGDPDFPAPGQSVYREHRHRWLPETL